MWPRVVNFNNLYCFYIKAKKHKKQTHTHTQTKTHTIRTLMSFDQESTVQTFCNENRPLSLIVIGILSILYLFLYLHLYWYLYLSLYWYLYLYLSLYCNQWREKGRLSFSTIFRRLNNKKNINNYNCNDNKSCKDNNNATHSYKHIYLSIFFFFFW